MPVVSPTAYNRALQRARSVTIRTGRVAIDRLETVFTNAAQAAAEAVGAATTPYSAARAASMRAQILEILASAELRARGVIVQNQSLSIDQVAQLHLAIVRDLAARAGVSVASSLLTARFASVPARTLAVLAARGANARNFRTLVNRHMEDAAASLDALIEGGLARGVAARTLAKDIQSLMLGGSASAPRSTYGLDSSDLSGLKTAWYDSRRIAVTEINNAYRESNHQALAASGIVDAVQWQLSGAHPAEDECDEIAEESSDGYPPGFYLLDEWPLAPHPFCACGQGAVMFLPTEEWFGSDQEPTEDEEE